MDFAEIFANKRGLAFKLEFALAPAAQRQFALFVRRIARFIAPIIGGRV